MPDPFAADLRGRVQARLDAEVDRQARTLAEIGPDAGDIVEPIRDLLRGGKRLRAAFVYWGWRAAGRPDDDGAVGLAAAMELFQAAALLHDDVMDDSDTRRGRPAAHRVLERAHTDRGWIGDGARFGASGAILAGDLCLGWCEDLYSGCGLPHEALAAARPVFERMRTQLMAGQYIDVVTAARPWHDLPEAERVERARHVIRYKSAKYSVEHPLLIGACAGGAGAADVEALSRYGVALGEAFQLRDDLLGVFGDPEATGKPAGDDLREGKRTVLVAHALGGADDLDGRRIETWLGDADLTDQDVEAFRAVLVDTGAVAAVERDIERGCAQARDALAGAPGLEPQARQVLEELVDLLTARSA